ncbi:hypothetical protein Pla123a_32850 [Posidoniimonas polymericola]|uniref:DUF4166 domain-containing protein n=2 Tax=Posidoniimonas polymericola TaxID=2528002 RepID=A0A5C5YI62_9BACT|nr:hypothetical protein Pla123a_32850 [Posidoniimonas polymericola]
MGSEFARLHSRIQEQYGITSVSQSAFIGRGVMEEVWHGRWYTVPFLFLGATRRILFPETGRGIPFEIRNYAYLDDLGRETVTWKRVFEFPRRTRDFDEYFVYSERQGGPVLYAGTHQHLSVDLVFEAATDGSLVVTTTRQQVHVGPFSIPFPRFFSGDAWVRESFDEERQCFLVDVAISNRFWGRILGYRGWFRLERVSCSLEDIPDGVHPIRVVGRH